jgi:carboxylate-amine ligase
MSHHPTADRFEGPQNKRRHDFWQWAMQAMVTYGPDVNVSLPPELNERLDFADLHAKVNYYAPALTALSLASPFYLGQLWKIRGRVGKSIRTYRRSVIAPAIELHPQEAGRLEYKTFETTNRLDDFHAFFLLWLELLLDDGLGAGLASRRGSPRLPPFTPAAETVRDRAAEVLDGTSVLASQLSPPNQARRRLETGRLPPMTHRPSAGSGRKVASPADPGRDGRGKPSWLVTGQSRPDPIEYSNRLTPSINEREARMRTESDDERFAVAALR